MERTQFLAVILALLILVAVGAPLTLAEANPAFLCDPIPVGIGAPGDGGEIGDICQCKFFNYGHKAKTVSIRIFGQHGQVNECLDVDVPSETGTDCEHAFTEEDDCGCAIEVSRIGGKLDARASINVLNPFGRPRPWDGRACR